ncbi:hypothetical protein CS331_002845 [Klebsiella pneumoniae subsp. pneumoniae]|uniref:hypothetical protein n=1 Tax=Klebsiella pneumoniae TaxID=573 RepID=UPI000C129AC0|nr:hypothetical protein [Klebsiella pneumoniae]MDE1779959.1 hypothetical protein [Klebsiella pneumoniae subsp. pneumoniae]MDE1794089.1 hypothetical protein [Klebsiella pneumoniae subsp. pneumoniae]MDE1805675.1 hypothetical protein [Klebsiella pneumoniae subsp. pneumoniae]
MTITIQAVNELIASLESAGELSIREQKFLKLAKAYQQLAAENVALNEQVRALAADNSALINSSVCTLQDGRPLHGFYASEWFIAKLKNGEYAALKALPEEYSYDYRTNDGTYYTKDWVVGWMQTPDTEYRPNVKTPATDRIVAGIKADEEKAVLNDLLRHMDKINIENLSSPWELSSEVVAFVNSRLLREGVDK